MRVIQRIQQRKSGGGKCECTFSCFKFYYALIMITIGLISGALYIIYKALLQTSKKELKSTIWLYTIFSVFLGYVAYFLSPFVYIIYIVTLVVIYNRYLLL